MDWMITGIVWDTDGLGQLSILPREVFVNWASDCETEEDAIDLVSDLYGYCILSCNITEE